MRKIKEKLEMLCQRFQSVPRKTIIKKSLLYLGIFFVCVLGCVKIRLETLPPVERWHTIWEIRFFFRGSYTLGRIETPSGAVFSCVSQYKKAFPDVDVAWQVGTNRVEYVVLDPFEEGGFKNIFYKNTVNYTPRSFMRKVTTRKGVDLVLCISPDLILNTQLPEYENSDWYGVEPYDTLNSEFTELHYRKRTQRCDVAGTYPVYLLALPYKEIPEDYELHFGEYVLTYNDIITQTWSPPGTESEEPTK